MGRVRLALPVWLTSRALVVLVLIALMLALAPAWSPLEPLAYGAGIAWVLALALDAAAGPARGELRIERVVPEHVALGRTITIGYAIEHRGRRAARVTIYETPLRTLQFDSHGVAGDVQPGMRTVLEATARPRERGADAFGDLYVTFANAIGFLQRRLRLSREQPFRVYPNLAAVERYGTLHVRNRLIEAGLRRMKLRGTGTEFESLREWSDGDAFRSIDWKATARRAKLMVAQHEVERSQNVMLLLDAGRLMTPRIGAMRKFDYAVTASLSLATIAGLSSDRVGAVAFAGRILTASAPRSTRGSIAALSEMLYDLEPRFEEANYARAFAYVRAHLRKRSLVVLLTDVIDPLAQSALLAQLGALARHHLVVCVFMNDAAVQAALTAPVRGDDDVYRARVAAGLADERRAGAATLGRLGILTIDVPAASLSTAVIDEYLRVKGRGLL